MKLLIKLTMALVFLFSNTIANAFTVDGVDYDVTSSTDLTCQAADYNNALTGAVSIPSRVTYSGVTYTVTSISLYNSSDLTSLSLPETISTVSISSCSNLQEINVNSLNPSLSSENGVLYDKTKTELIFFPSGSTITNFTIPSSVVYVCLARAFDYCPNLLTLNIPSSVTQLKESPSGSADYLCFPFPNLQEINVDGSNTHFSSLNGVLYDKQKKNLLAYPRGKNGTSFIVPSSVTHIVENACSFNKYIGSVTLPDNLISIGRSAFSGCENLSSISLPISVEEIGTSAFSSCTKLTSFTIPENLSFIGDSPFYSCEFESLYYNATNLSTSSDVYGVFQNCKIGKLYIGENVQKVPYFGRGGSLDPEDGVYITNLSSWCSIDFAQYAANPLYWCKRLYLNDALLTQINIPSDVNRIGDYAFYGSTNFEKISIPNSVTHFGSGAFYDIVFDNLTIGENVTYIGWDAFTKVKNLNYNATSCNKCCSFSSLESLSIGDNVQIIPNGFLSYCQGLTSINIPESVISIGDRAFYGCYNIKSLTLPNVTDIGEYIIANSGIETLVIKGGIETIRPNTFRDATNLKNIYLPETLIEIGDFAFYNCNKLESIDLPKSITAIGQAAFYSCSGLTDIVIPDNVNYLPFQCFIGCGLSSITLPKNLESIGNGVFFANNFSSVISRNPIPPTFISDKPSTYTGRSFGNFTSTQYADAILYVPKGSIEAYKSADIWQNFQNIVEIQPTEVNLIDGEDFVNDEPIENITVTYTRNYSSTGWHALYLPFDMAYDEWADYGVVAKLNNVHQYDTDNDGVLDKTTIEYNRVTSGNIRANTPYVFKPHAAGEITFTCEDRTVFAAPAQDAHVDCSTTEMLYTIYGNFQTKSGLKNMGAYALSSDGAFVQAKTESQTLKPYRIYLIISPRTDGGYVDAPMLRMPERVEVVVDGETTSIEDLFISTQEENVYYDLMGRPIHNPTTGIYFLNGRKVYIK